MAAMSTITSSKSLNPLRTKDIKIFSVVTKREKLADFVRRVRTEKGYSLPLVERQARARGKKISNGYVSQIENGQILNVSPTKLKALAAGLDVTEDEIFSIARGSSPTDDPNFQKSRFAALSLKFSSMPPSKQAKAEPLLEVLEREFERLVREQ